MEIFGQGVLLLGPSGVGKSTLSYQLVANGHPLIADDIVELELASEQNLIGKSDKIMLGKLMLANRKLIDVRTLFGQHLAKCSTILSLILNLSPKKQQDLHPNENTPNISYRLLRGVSLPEITLPFTANQHGASHIECAVANYLQSKKR